MAEFQLNGTERRKTVDFQRHSSNRLIFCDENGLEELFLRDRFGQIQDVQSSIKNHLKICRTV